MFRFVILCLAFFALVPLPLSLQAAPNSIGMMTGAKTGTYHQIGQEIARIGEKEGIPLTIRTSSGSVENLEKMATTGENAALGIVQSDVISFLLRSTMPKSKEIARKLRVVAPLFKEEVHLLARIEINDFQELAGKRVVVGSAGSGSMMTAVNLLAQLGVKPKRLFEVSPAEAIVAVLANRADAVIFVGGKPVPMFENLAKLEASGKGDLLAQVHLLPISADRAKGIYETATLTPADYPFVHSDVPTLAVRSVLVAYDFTLKNTPYYKSRCNELRELGRALARELPTLKNGGGHAKWAEVDLARDLKLWQRDKCVWPGIQSLTGATTSPTGVLTLEEGSTDAETAIPQHSGFEKELLGIISGK